MLYAFTGNQAAVDFVLIVARVADVWDNLIDKDAPVSDKDINDAFWQLAVDLPRNVFYRAHMDEILPVMETGILNWMTANALECDSTNVRAIEIAHVIRYGIADVALLTAALCGGREWAEQVGPELRMRSQHGDWTEYIGSLRAKREVNHAAQ
ncbi:MAG: hypothetical protein NT159_05820 [Proteobacteria bacterium]|nr:hypothetical protein [Pseudomonadota bacterium]